MIFSVLDAANAAQRAVAGASTTAHKEKSTLGRTARSVLGGGGAGVHGQEAREGLEARNNPSPPPPSKKKKKKKRRHNQATPRTHLAHLAVAVVISIGGGYIRRGGWCAQRQTSSSSVNTPGSKRLASSPGIPPLDCLLLPRLSDHATLGAAIPCGPITCWSALVLLRLAPGLGDCLREKAGRSLFASVHGPGQGLTMLYPPPPQDTGREG